MTTRTIDHGRQAGIAASNRYLPAALALGLGLFLIFGIGFASPTTIHNAAHDARHAIAFPCH